MCALQVIDRGAGIAIVWIHGFPLSSLIFEQQLTVPGVRHIVPDLPGFGQSAPTGLDSIDDYAAAVTSMLDELAIDSAVIAGVSMGGYVAFSIVRQRPEMVAGLLLIDTKEAPDSAEARTKRLSHVERVGREGAGFIIEDMLPKMLTPATQALADRRSEIVRQAMSSASTAGVQSALRAMAGRIDSTEALRAFPRPVLVVVGSEDSITPPSDAERMAALARHSTLVTIPDAAHLSNVERPEAFNRAAQAFLKPLE